MYCRMRCNNSTKFNFYDYWVDAPDESWHNNVKLAWNFQFQLIPKLRICAKKPVFKSYESRNDLLGVLKEKRKEKLKQNNPESLNPCSVVPSQIEENISYVQQ